VVADMAVLVAKTPVDMVVTVEGCMEMEVGSEGIQEASRIPVADKIGSRSMMSTMRVL